MVRSFLPMIFTIRLLLGAATWVVIWATTAAQGIELLSGPLSAIAEPLASSSTQDRALGWALANMPAGSRTIETGPGPTPGAMAGATVGIPTERYEVVYSYTNEDL